MADLERLIASELARQELSRERYIEPSASAACSCVIFFAIRKRFKFLEKTVIGIYSSHNLEASVLIIAKGWNKSMALFMIYISVFDELKSTTPPAIAGGEEMRPYFGLNLSVHSLCSGYPSIPSGIRLHFLFDLRFFFHVPPGPGFV